MQMFSDSVAGSAADRPAQFLDTEGQNFMRQKIGKFWR